MSSQKVRWGIIGCANIARKNLRAIRLSPNSIVQAIASRSLDKAKAFVEENELPLQDSPSAVQYLANNDGIYVNAYGSYNELLNDDNVDAVYIPLPTTFHLQWVTAAAEKKKHVLVEKPVATSYEEAKKMVQVCKENNVQLMDGVMWMHHSRTHAIRHQLDTGMLGQILRVTSGFSFLGGEDFFTKNIRVKADADPLGCLGDLGWYCIRGILFARNYELPVRVGATALRRNEESVVLNMIGWLEFQDGTISSFDSSFDTPNRQWMEIAGSKGVMRWTDFVNNEREDKAEWRTEIERKTSSNGVDFSKVLHTTLPCCQEAELFTTFSGLVQKGVLDDSWTNLILSTQRVVQALHDSMNNAGHPVQLS